MAYSTALPFFKNHRNKVIHGVYFVGNGLGLCAAVGALVGASVLTGGVFPAVVIGYNVLWNLYDGVCAFTDATECSNNIKRILSNLASSKRILSNLASYDGVCAFTDATECRNNIKRILSNLASSFFLIAGTIAAFAMLFTPLAPIAPAVMSIVFAIAMVCSLMDSVYNKGKEDNESKNGILKDKVSWGLCVLGMTLVAAVTTVATFGAVPASIAVAAAAVACFSAFYRVINSYYNRRVGENKSDTKEEALLSL